MSTKDETKDAGAGEPRVEVAGAAEPRVETVPTFQKGDRVRHQNKNTYTVLEHHAEGVRLEGVANFVHPSALRLVRDEPAGEA